ncbi:hypothetical protein EUTSA_v10028286mg [Eutrema salsugineum]|uniref:TF-B3 domain-containing protein n=1 Tax=Eutrema salsugineum TaxID=72664 RepID=V4L9W1_EUTSA|nr:putative B3 domain-containing protein At1g78640 [Eutrema salsugineum]ESQ47205.1 hypothetical protein EUTSA_v10028286mg [Eutrema salsugineum]
MVYTENSRSSSPTTPRTLDLFPTQAGDLAHVVSSANDEVVTLAHLRNNLTEEAARNVLTLSTKPIRVQRRTRWVIKKTLTRSDVAKSQTRLLIPMQSVNEHIRRYLMNDEIRMIEDDDSGGFIVNVYDTDTHSTHWLCLKRWNSTGSYVLKTNWSSDFVIRRNLQEGDEIGLFWNNPELRFHFCVFPPPGH